jgi:hypothetical protein
MPYHGRPQRLAAGDLAVNDKAQGFFGHHSRGLPSLAGVFRAAT